MKDENVKTEYEKWQRSKFMLVGSDNTGEEYSYPQAYQLVQEHAYLVEKSR